MLLLAVPMYDCQKRKDEGHLDVQASASQPGQALVPITAVMLTCVCIGELHNNIRMTWGKAILPWSPDPDTAIKRTVYLNHKYALDGCDPCSYSGILWCYGQFDKPMGPESTPIYGKLRKRDTSVVGNKLDVATYRSLAIEPDNAEIGGQPAQKAISDFFAPRH